MSEESPETVVITPTKAPTILVLPSGAKILHTKCRSVEKVTPATKALAQALEDYLKTHQHDDPRPIGIAAPQLGKSIRMFSYILNVSGETLTLINPELMYEKKLHLTRETCLSIPGRVYKIKRGRVVKIRGMLVNGSTRSFKSHGTTAQVFLHELDHLNGITIDTVGERIK